MGTISNLLHKLLHDFLDFAPPIFLFPLLE